MFLTFCTPANNIYKEYTTKAFFDMLNNNLSTYVPPQTKMLRRTVVINDDYAKRYLEKHPIEIKNPPVPFNINEIKEHYRSFKIPKKTDPKKFRHIDAPDEPLKAYHRAVKTLYEYTFRIQPHYAAHAYVHKQSTITALKEHQRNESKWFLKLDMKDFFPSHNKKYILRMLKMIYPFGALDDIEFKAVEQQIDYALLDNKLPQGTPLSPMLTNITMVPIDYEIANTLRNFERKHLIYTRYADDMLISCKYEFDYYKVISEINRILKKYKAPFKINREKTRYGSAAGRNWNLGIMLNKDNKLTIGHKANQIFRAKLYDFVCNHEHWPLEQVQETLGLISYYRSIEPSYINYTINKYSRKYGIDIEKEMKKQVAKLY